MRAPEYLRRHWYLGRHWRWSLGCLIVAGTVASMLIIGPGSGAFAGHGCAEVPLSVSPDATDMQEPYGTVTSCRELRRTGYWFAGGKTSVYLLLETGSGPVAVRVDYLYTGSGRAFTAVAVELPADRAPLNATDTRRVEAATAARGGVRTQSWTLHYGDG